MKNRIHHESGEQVEERLHPDQQKTMAIHFQAHRGGTCLHGIGSEFIKFLIVQNSSLLQLVSFTVDTDPL